MSYTVPHRPLLLLPCLLACACEGVIERPGPLGDYGYTEKAGLPDECIVLDFETDGDGNPITAGSIIESAYASLGILLDVWVSPNQSKDGLGVAFDSANPTGGDDDLSYPDQGMLLINQEHFKAKDIQNGFVSKPDDDARGGFFDFSFDPPVCMRAVTALDIDTGEAPMKLDLYDVDGNLLGTFDAPPTGNNERSHVDLPASDECNVARATFTLCSSGALDDIEVCYEPQERVLWERFFDGGDDEQGTGVAALGGDAIVSGFSDMGGTTMGFVRRYSETGALVWSMLLPDLEARAVATGPGGAIYVAAIRRGADSDFALLRLDDTGAFVWQRLFDNGGDEGARGVAVDGDGNIIAVGFAEAALGNDALFRKYDDDGNLIFSEAFDSGNDDQALAVAAADDGGFAVSGYSMNASDRDLFVQRRDDDGNLLWSRSFDGGGDDTGDAVALSESGDVVVAGESDAGASTDIFVRAFNPAGDVQWTHSEDSGSDDGARGVAIDMMGNVVVTGHSAGDGWTRKLDTEGVELFTELFTGAGDDGAQACALTDLGAIFVTGFTSNATDTDLWVTHYRP